MRSISILPGRNEIVSGANSIFTWNIATGDVESELKGHAKNIIALACSLDGKIIVSSSADRTTKVWKNSGSTTNS